MMFNRRIWHLANILLVLTLLLTLRIAYWQLVRGPDLQPVGGNPLAQVVEDTRPTDPADALSELTGSTQTPHSLGELPLPVLQRIQRQLSDITRGSIYDRNGHLLAFDQVDANGSKYREYTEPSLAPVVGYVSGLRTGVAGVEFSQNSLLLGLNRVDSQVRQGLHVPVTGDSLILTIDTEAQRTAEQALGDRAGAVVAMDAHTGAVLVMASTPHFDPNQVLDENYISNLINNCNNAPTCRAPFLNRATQSLYTPGSTWKTVTLIAGLDTGQITTKTMFDFGQPISGPNGSYYVYRVGGGVIPDPNHKESKLDLPMAYAKSANAAFAKIGDEMPPEVFLNYAAKFNFGAPGEKYIPLEVPYNPSQVANDPQELITNDLLRAATAIGQGELFVNPLSMAMVTAAVVNNGDMPMPYLVDRVRTPYGVTTPGPLKGRVERNLFKSSTAKDAFDMMVLDVTSGSGLRAAIPGLTVGGKTGTAQLGGDLQPHAWFIGFAQKDQQAVALAVMVENGGGGWDVAAPVFAQVAKVALDHLQQQGNFQLEATPAP